MSSKVTAALGVFAVLALVAGSAHAQTGKCQGAKLKAAGKKASCLLALDSKVAGGKAADPIKVAACHTKMQDAFTKAESKPPCATPGDYADIEGRVDDYVDGVNADLSKSLPNKCQAAKMKAAGKKSKCLFSLAAKVAAGKPPAPLKVQACKDKMLASFNKAELPGGCGTTGDYASVEATVDLFVDLLSCVLQGSAPCNCGSATPSFVGFTTTVGAGTCGQVLDDSAASLASLDCSKLYIGGSGAGAVPPGTVPDYGTSKYTVECCTGKRLFLAASTSAQTGSTLDCTSTGCFFGAPLPIVNPTNTGLSTCVLNSVATDAVGGAMCDAGSMDISMPLSSKIWLTGDTVLPTRCGPTAPNPGGKCSVDADCAPDTCNDDSAAIQPCPICNPSTNRCNGGPNDGLGCVPGTLLATGDEFPTSHDCPPPFLSLATLSIPDYALTTGTASKTSVDLPAQSFVFCGFCGSPSAPSFKKPPVPCTSNADCTGITGCPGTNPCSVCKQRNSGAFGQGPARTITQTGSPGGDLTTGPKSSTMGGIFCVPPTFVAAGLVDGNADLPGPGAVGLPGTLSLIP